MKTNKNIKSKIGRLRVIAFLEGSSLILLVFFATPLKYFYDYNLLVEILGPIHGILFLLFVLNTFIVGIEQNWKFSVTTWKVLLACLIPFGVLYIDRNILSKLN